MTIKILNSETHELIEVFTHIITSSDCDVEFWPESDSIELVYSGKILDNKLRKYGEVKRWNQGKVSFKLKKEYRIKIKL